MSFTWEKQLGSKPYGSNQHVLCKSPIVHVDQKDELKKVLAKKPKNQWSYTLVLQFTLLKNIVITTTIPSSPSPHIYKPSPPSTKHHSCVPCSTILPSCTTPILSTPLTVASLCATTTVVLPLITLSSASCKTSSDSASNALVASSKSKIAGFFKTALAIAILCLCPPESCTPFSPTCVSYPRGSPVTKTCAFAALAASTTSPSVAPSFPYAIFSKMLPENKTGSC
ncbi:GRAS family transcription factor family protein [Striga asiatica]|uniref:GRAS family transcription factor family protein n=1 Tax=Striga asiatica TaxID=4170 RepID=A0A5A7QZG3_STRAF|nr:GRAS family transcription factor family protein [Striga asiatica]